MFFGDRVVAVVVVFVAAAAAAAAGCCWTSSNIRSFVDVCPISPLTIDSDVPFLSAQQILERCREL